MADLVFHRLGGPSSFPMVCMHCGQQATHRDEKKVYNPVADPAPSPKRRERVKGNVFDVLQAAGAFLLWLTRWWPDRPRPAEAPPLVPDHTLVVFISCDRHRHYRRWYRSLVLIVGVLLLVGWAVLFVLLPFTSAFFWGLGAWVLILLGLAALFRAPVRIKYVLRDTVTVTGVHKNYLLAVAEGVRTP
jgi:hypothetical protein